MKEIVSLIGKYTTLKRKGWKYWGLCPLHEEKTPSFCVTPITGRFYCFGCHKGGDKNDFKREMKKKGIDVEL